jgi:uncharacterized protein YcsI (UPF0317 family)
MYARPARQGSPAGRDRSPRSLRVGHLARVEAIESCFRAHPGLALAGGAYRGLGIADCVRSGEDAAGRLLDGARAWGSGVGETTQARQVMTENEVMLSKAPEKKCFILYLGA